jgi:hypothetical protein
VLVVVVVVVWQHTIEGVVTTVDVVTVGGTSVVVDTLTTVLVAVETSVSVEVAVTVVGSVEVIVVVGPGVNKVIVSVVPAFEPELEAIAPISAVPPTSTIATTMITINLVLIPLRCRGALTNFI